MLTSTTRTEEHLLPRETPLSAQQLLGPAEGRWPRTIIVCADDSPSTDDALTAARGLANRVDAEVHLVSVFEPRIPLPNVPGRQGADRCESCDRNDAAELLHRVRAKEEQQFGRVEWPVQLEVGHPMKTILARASSTNADLLVLGLGSREARERQRSGGTAASLARYIEIPLLAAGPMTTALPQRAILWVDRATPDLSTVRTTLRCLDDEALLWVLIYGGTGRSADGVRHDKATISRILTMVRQEASVLSKHVVVRATYRTGDAVEALLTMARDVNADLIGAPAHGEAGTVRSLLPSVAERLLLTAPCSVLVVPESPRTKAARS